MRKPDGIVICSNVELPHEAFHIRSTDINKALSSYTSRFGYGLYTDCMRIFYFYELESGGEIYLSDPFIKD